jgi:hypothetical protein
MAIGSHIPIEMPGVGMPPFGQTQTGEAKLFVSGAFPGIAGIFPIVIGKNIPSKYRLQDSQSFHYKPQKNYYQSLK